MEKVKIFTRCVANEFDELEEEINKWLEKNPVVIVSRHVSNVFGTNIAGRDFLNCTVAIFYHPVKRT
ncbi:hypothetical protein KJ639_00380 [Patescibacteria group bacterium]|nr:hypothetical protein [Patescibacteria group bacterium]